MNMTWYEWTGNVCGAITLLGGAILSIKEFVVRLRKSIERKAIEQETEEDRVEEDAEKSGKPIPQRVMNGRDRSRFLLDGDPTQHFKGRLVLAVVRKYIQMNPNCTAKGLKQTFPDSLL